MTKQIKKCPNCGHIFKDGEEYCPNCDLFIPIDQQKNNSDTPTFNDEPVKKHVTASTESYHNEPTFKHRGKTVEQLKADDDFDASTEEDVPSIIDSTDEQDVSISITEDQTDLESDSDVEESNETEHDPIIDTEMSIPSPTKENELTNNKTPKKTSKKGVVGLVVALVVIVGGLFYFNYHQKQVEADKIAELTSTAEFDLNSLYSNSDHVFLKENISQSDIDKAKKSVDALKGKAEFDDLKKKMDEIETQYNRLVSINKLFKTPIISGEHLDNKAYLKAQEKVSLTKSDPEENGFDILFNKALLEASSQYDINEKAIVALNTVYKDNKVEQSVTKEQYAAAEKAVTAVKDPELKQQQQDILDKVKSYLDEKAKKEAEVAEKEKQQQAELAQQAKDNTPKLPATPSTGSNQTGRWGNRQDATIDLSSDAWSWSAGVQDKVINEVINRGYVAPGGYTLVPKYVENGEGFYDLYATTNSKIFPKSKPEEFPLYVVTINCKTGWFKGNGPN